MLNAASLQATAALLDNASLRAKRTFPGLSLQVSFYGFADAVRPCLSGAAFRSREGPRQFELHGTREPVYLVINAPDGQARPQHGRATRVGAHHRCVVHDGQLVRLHDEHNIRLHQGLNLHSQ